MNRPASLLVAVAAAVALVACTDPVANSGDEDCSVRDAVAFTDTPVAPTPIEAIEAAVASGDLTVAEDDVAVLVDQLSELAAGDTPIFVGVEGITLTITPTDGAWQVTEQEQLTDC